VIVNEAGQTLEEELRELGLEHLSQDEIDTLVREGETLDLLDEWISAPATPDEHNQPLTPAERFRLITST